MPIEDPTVFKNNFETIHFNIKIIKNCHSLD